MAVADWRWHQWTLSREAGSDGKLVVGKSGSSLGPQVHNHMLAPLPYDPDAKHGMKIVFRERMLWEISDAWPRHVMHASAGVPTWRSRAEHEQNATPAALCDRLCLTYMLCATWAHQPTVKEKLAPVMMCVSCAACALFRCILNSSF